MTIVVDARTEDDEEEHAPELISGFDGRNSLNARQTDDLRWREEGGGRREGRR